MTGKDYLHNTASKAIADVSTLLDRVAELEAEVAELKKPKPKKAK